MESTCFTATYAFNQIFVYIYLAHTSISSRAKKATVTFQERCIFRNIIQKLKCIELWLKPTRQCTIPLKLGIVNFCGLIRRGKVTYLEIRMCSERLRPRSTKQVLRRKIQSRPRVDFGKSRKTESCRRSSCRPSSKSTKE